MTWEEFGQGVVIFAAVALFIFGMVKLSNYIGSNVRHGCDANARLVVNATDHFYDGRCYVVVGGQAKEIK